MCLFYPFHKNYLSNIKSKCLRRLEEKNSDLLVCNLWRQEEAEDVRPVQSADLSHCRQHCLADLCLDQLQVGNNVENTIIFVASFFAFQHNVLDRDFLDFRLFCTFSVNLRMKTFQTNIFPALHAALESNAAECGAKTFEPSKLWTTATVSRRDPSWWGTANRRNAKMGLQRMKRAGRDSTRTSSRNPLSGRQHPGAV